METWLANGQPPCFWLSGFFFPQGFITGVLQSHSRKHKVAIDLLNFEFQVLDLDKEDILEPPKVLKSIILTFFQEGVYIYGLFMDGARWDRNDSMIDDQFPGEMYCPMPVILFKPVENYVANEDDY